MDWLGLAHFITALAAIVTGTVVVLRPKGTRFHKWLGRVCFATMLGLKKDNPVTT